ncbi:MAG: site-specific DNA-methyltransferase [Clostridia bacterium]|nr:site-specific DNA-methyltransferase [Clostridia bacterium]
MLIKSEKININNSFFGSLPGEFYLADTLEIMPELIEKHAGKVKLVYFDPPFMTGREFDANMPVGEKGFAGNRQYFAKIPSYSDQWESREAYLEFLGKVLEGTKELLTDDGVVCVHVDRHASAYVRILLDKVFGENCFINEIIWHYHSGGSSKHSFPAKHDNIYIYGKKSNVKINPAAAGKARTDKKQNHMKKNVDVDGRVYFSIKSNGKEYKYYEDDIVSFDDVWDIPHLQQKHPERTGFGTQKPLELLDRIIKSCSREGDIVCDLFAGSGTTLISAFNNNRRFIGVDKAALSLLTFRRRLTAKSTFDVEIFHTSKPNDMAGISIQKAESENHVTISFEAYRALDVESTLPKYSDGLQYLNYVSVGRIEGETFITEAYSVRTPGKPALKCDFTVEKGGKKAVYFCDCLGNHRFVEI